MFPKIFFNYFIALDFFKNKFIVFHFQAVKSALGNMTHLKTDNINSR